MTVAELIEKLKEFDQNLHVAIFDDGSSSDAEKVELLTAYYPEATDSVVIY